MRPAQRVAFKVWTALPESVQRQPAIQGIRRRLAPPRGVAVPPQHLATASGAVSPEDLAGPPRPAKSKQRVVRTLAELDAEFVELDRLALISDDALRTGFDQFRMEIDFDMPKDPWSSEYRTKVFDFYDFLHGRPYQPSHEVTDVVSVEAHVSRPFPYSTGSANTVGGHLIGIGHVVRSLDLPPGSRVLEMGVGWGNTTLALAQMGHDVTAVDIAANFVELVAERAARVDVQVDARQGDFALIRELDPGFDAVLFFESFHHAADHIAVIESLDRVVAPGGKVLFAAEPIFDGLPYPWGLRLEGESLWAIRRHGWLELGFQPGYFQETLRRHGWRTERVEQSGTMAGVIYVARRIAE